MASMDYYEPSERFRRMDRGLAEIEGTLGQMLMLSELSASDMNLDRKTMQETLEHLKRKIDRLADGLETL